MRRMKYAMVGLLVACLGMTGCPESQQTANNDDGEFNIDENRDDVDVAVPEGVTATEGEVAEAVVVQWESVEDADGYLVVRDDEDEFEVGADETEFVDEGADAPEAPEAPYGIEASDSEGGGVIVEWEFDEPKEGARHDYVVYPMVDGDTVTGPSEEVTGWRGPYPWEFQVYSEAASEWFEAGDDHQYIDEEAPYGDIVDPGRVRASRGTYADRVHLRIDDLETTPGPEAEYRVRVSDGHHDTASSATVSGRRGQAMPDARWQRSSTDEPVDFDDLDAGSSVPFNDMEAPADGSIRYWRATLQFPDGDEEMTTDHDWGYRAIDCAVEDDFDGEYDDSWYDDFAPTDVTTDETMTGDANLEALWEATTPAYNDEDPRELSPPIDVDEAVVVATTFRENRQFWVRDGHTAMHVYLAESLDEEIEVGQQVSFVATELDVFNGDPEVSRLEDFSVDGENYPVTFHDVRIEGLTLEDHHYELVRVGGRLDDGEYCGSGYTCYDLTYGPAGDRHSVSFRTDDEDMKEGGCVTYLGPVIGFLGPEHPEADELGAPQLQDDLYRWTSFVNP